MTLLRRTLCIAGTLAVAACSNPGGPSGPPPLITALPRSLSSVEQEMVDASTTFGVRLLREVNTSFADSNVFLSPLSASMALGMTMNGAVGTTFDEMRGALGFGPRTHEELNAAYQSLITLLRDLDPRVDFRLANGIYYADVFGPFIETAFLDDAREFFDAAAAALDFATPEAVDSVNAWASRNTNGRIPKVIDQILPEHVMFLMNAIYFKGDWRDAFDPAKTQDAAFTTHTGETIQVPTMNRTGGFRVGHSGNTTVVELPYGGDAFVMTILLPHESVHINDFVAALTPESWQQATANLSDAGDRIPLSLPKFKLVWGDTLNDELKRMGMQQAFVKGGADFSRISAARGRDLYIDFVKQNTFVDVNEVGTEAAAVTVVGVGITSAPLPILINRPFVFAIRERLSGTVLFLGKIVKPELGS